MTATVDNRRRERTTVDMCAKDGQPCRIDGDEPHFRCGTVQCGKRVAVPEDVRYAPIGAVVVAPNGERWVRLSGNQAAWITALVGLRDH